MAKQRWFLSRALKYVISTSVYLFKSTNGPSLNRPLSVDNNANWRLPFPPQKNEIFEIVLVAMVVAAICHGANIQEQVTHGSSVCAQGLSQLDLINDL